MVADHVEPNHSLEQRYTQAKSEIETTLKDLISEGVLTVSEEAFTNTTETRFDENKSISITVTIQNDENFNDKVKFVEETLGLILTKFLNREEFYVIPPVIFEVPEQNDKGGLKAVYFTFTSDSRIIQGTRDNLVEICRADEYPGLEL